MPHWSTLCKRIRNICDGLGFEPVFPVNPEVDLLKTASSGLDMREKRRVSRILFMGNLVKVGSSDIVVANLAGFRGDEPDSGTVVEVSHAWANRIPVIGYRTIPHTMTEWALENGGTVDENTGNILDDNGYLVEDFDNPVNLMVAEQCSVMIYGNIQRALVEARAFLRNH